MEQILFGDYLEARVKQLLSQGRITADDEMWLGDAGDTVIGDVPQNEDAEYYVLKCTIAEFLEGH